MSTRTRRGGVVALLLLMVATLGFVNPPAASAADVIIPISWNVNASTHIKSLNMDVVVPQGTFTGEINVTTGALTGTIALPPATKDIKFLGLKLASATFAMSPAGPITGHVNLATMEVTVNTSFNFKISKATLSIAPWLNLVGRNCTGTTPVSVAMTGKVDLSGPSSFSSTYTIPPFKDCGLLVTPLLNLIIPGPGNTFTASFAPPAPVTP